MTQEAEQIQLQRGNADAEDARGIYRALVPHCIPVQHRGIQEVRILFHQSLIN
jgi:carbamate kinase